MNFTSEEAAGIRRLFRTMGPALFFSFLLPFYVNVYDGLTFLGPCSRYVDVDQLELVTIRRGR